MPDNHSVLTEIQTIFRDVLDQPDLVITRQSSARTVEDWDSFAHIVVIHSIEKHFGIKFALNEVGNLQNVGEMLDLLETKMASKS
jgi:acyl carrier protein